MNFNNFLENLFSRTDAEIGFVFRHSYLLLYSTQKELYLNQLKNALCRQNKRFLFEEIVSLHDFLFLEKKD